MRSRNILRPVWADQGKKEKKERKIERKKERKKKKRGRRFFPPPLQK
jgi:hypothetical protein